jgi:dolichol-phosphate mannosyltransferase
VTVSQSGSAVRPVVVVPTYNERENIRPLVEQLLASHPTVDVLCVDDDSPDGTGAIADKIAASEPRFHVLHRTEDRGYARSCLEGLAWCRAEGYDYVVTMDGDLSHDPARVPALLDRAIAGADLVIGSRYVAGGGVKADWGPVRRAVSEGGSGYARAMIGAPVRDCTSGYRCYRASAVDLVLLNHSRSEGYAFLIESLAAMHRAGARIEESPITYVDRRHGQSKISSRIVLEALIETTRLGAARVFGGRYV